MLIRAADACVSTRSLVVRSNANEKRGGRYVFRVGPSGVLDSVRGYAAYTYFQKNMFILIFDQLVRFFVGKLSFF